MPAQAPETITTAGTQGNPTVAITLATAEQEAAGLLWDANIN
jgi:hypothetical protein